MCEICNVMNIDLNSVSENTRVREKYRLLTILYGAQKDHPWHFMVAPMSDPERAWYDLDSDRRPRAK